MKRPYMPALVAGAVITVAAILFIFWLDFQIYMRTHVNAGFWTWLWDLAR